MVSISSLAAALGFAGVSLLPIASAAVATPGFRDSASTSYRHPEFCPERCSVSGPNTGNWSVYPNFKQLKKCGQTMLYGFSLFDPVDDPTRNHKIHACSSLEEGLGPAASELSSLVEQIRQYTKNGHGASDTPLIVYGQSGQATIGLYIGQGLLQEEGLGDSALEAFQDSFENLNVSTPSVAMQLCEKGYSSTHISGIMATGSGIFAPIQDAIQSWVNGTCLSFAESIKSPGQAKFTMPSRRANPVTRSTSGTTKKVHARSECETVQVEPGKGCPELAEKCGISGDDFTKYNPGDGFCGKLMPKQHVCCSEGDLPDFSPQPNEDGSCYSYQVKSDDNCDNLAAEFDLTRDDIESFNKNTWGWNGCSLLFKETIMCLSEGIPPFPAPIANAKCGPQKPGTQPPTDDTNIADLNPCPLNACCNIWGQCGITPDFCIDTNTGAPGTAAPDTYGCISNCGMDVVQGDGTGAIKIAYYEGYCLSRECLFQDASQIDTSKYTHIHFGFGTLTPSFDVETGDTLSTYQFGEFQRLSGVKKVLSFGGWDFSNMPETYQIFRNAVKPENRGTTANKIADFIKGHGLDGVDIDWEYPGAPDLPLDDPGSPEDGPNYLEFLKELKELLPGKSVSIAAPSSYWYLKQFPIKDISQVVDYIVYMTYDLHGQWDAQNPNAQAGCEDGNCLRSQVNLTETTQSLAMITKAGVPGNKVVVGVTSYGRSFKMADEGCWGPECQYTGDMLNSNAKKGKCTGTAGYLADAEISEILDEPDRVVQHFFDEDSDSDILVYDSSEWVGYMSAATKDKRAALYAGWGLGGTTDWASDLQTYHEVPPPTKSWAMFKELVLDGLDPPKGDDMPSGSWTDFNCKHPMTVNTTKYTPSNRWKTLRADDAWENVKKVWNETDPGQHTTFMEIVSDVLHIGSDAQCGELISDSCVTKECPDGANGDTSGPAAELIWDSLVKIHMLYKDYHNTLFQVAALSGSGLQDFENKFAPVPPEEDKTWALVLIDLLTLGTLGSIAPFFNTYLKRLPGFLENGRDNAKDTAMTLVSQSTTIAKDVLPSEDIPWTSESQAEFSSYVAQVISGWANITAQALHDVFNGSTTSIHVLEKAMANGQLIVGLRENSPPASTTEENRKNALRANIEKCYYGYSIPALWKVSKANAFIVDAGYDCDDPRQPSEYITSETRQATFTCVEGRQYYLVYPKGDAVKCRRVCKHEHDCETKCENQRFSAPPGLEFLNGQSFGGITKDMLITGSVLTWAKNGHENGGGSPDPTDQETINHLMDVDVTTPGFIRIPVCKPKRAFQSWKTAEAGSSEFYPCDIPPGKDECGDSSFENETSDASPNAADCEQIIENIEGDASKKWTTQVVGKNQREIESAGTCAFGVEATAVDGNVNFAVGGQDVIDLIKESIKRFADGDGKLGAKGDMKCSGNDGLGHDQKVRWGIYHT